MSRLLRDETDVASGSAQGVDVEDAKAGTHAFTILARILSDPRLDIGKPREGLSFYKHALDKTGDTIREYVDQWDLTGDLGKKLEELLWTNVLIYGVGGSEKCGNFNADFFL